MQDLQTLFQQIAKHWGYEIGKKVKSEIQAVIDAENVDIQKLQDAIKTIQGLLDADPDTPEFDVGQNIITQLTDHLNRIKNLENAVNILNGDESTAGSVDYKVKQAKDELQAEIDALKGDSQSSIADLQQEVDNIEKGAGLDENGNYVADSNATYIKDATSLADADSKLDKAIKELADKEAQDVANLQQSIDEKSAQAEANAKAYADETFVKKSDVDAIDVCALTSMFAQAIDCGLQGKSEEDCCGNSCSNNSDSGDNSSSSSDSGSNSSSDSSSDSSSNSSDDSDGAVV
jgi:chromosome segregation ATPase